jgi:hypothetical protein
LASGLGTTSRSGAKVFWFFFFKKELLVFTYFFNFSTAWELRFFCCFFPAPAGAYAALIHGKRENITLLITLNKQFFYTKM